MGLMTTLRNRSGLLIGAIGFAIVAFLVSDAMMSGSPFLQDYQNEIGEVGGEDISYQEFDNKLNQNIESYKANSQQGSIDDNIRGYLVDQTWNQMVSDIVMKRELEKLGLTLSVAELMDMVAGKNPHPQVRSAFTNQQTGVFNPNDVMNFLRTMDERDPSGETRKQWLAFEKGIKEERIRQKYLSLIKNGLYVPTAHAKDDYRNKNTQASIKYVSLSYHSISDSTIQVSESDLAAYHKENSHKYKQKEDQRTFEYVVFEVIPSSVDSAEVKKWFTDQVEAFKTTKDDSVYISLNADTKYTGAFSKKGQLSPALDSIMFNVPVGTVYGPYLEGNSYKLAKLIEVRSMPDSVKARHILIKPVNGNIEAAKTKADSLKKLIKGGASFAELAKTHSEDKGSGEKGGDLGYFDNKQMVKPFSDAAFLGKTGDMPIVESQFGIHLIEIQDQKNMAKAVKVGVIDRSIDASTATIQSVYAKANTLLGSIKTGEEFKDQVTKAGLTPRVAENLKENDKFLAGLENPRELIRWAYKADKGDISPLYELGNKFVFAHLTEIKNKGIIPLEYIKTEVEVAARREKKVEMLKEKLEKAAAGASKIEEVAAKAGTEVRTAENINFAYPVIPGVAREPEVVGTIFGLGQGKLSKPVRGEHGVFIIYVEKITEGPPTADYTMSKLQLLNPIKQRVDMAAVEALKEKANVTDNRVKFY